MHASIAAFVATLSAFRAKLPETDEAYQLRVGIARTIKELEALDLRVMKHARDNNVAQPPVRK